MYLVFIPAFGELAIPEFIGGGKTFFVGNIISLFIWDQSTAPLGISLTITSVVFLIIALLIIDLSLKLTNKFVIGVNVDPNR